MSDEIDRLRAFAAEYQKITGEPAEPILRKIARLESESADPWRDLREVLSDWNGALDNGKVIGEKACDAASQLETLLETNDRLTAENARLTKRVAELEPALKRIATVPDCGCVPCRGQCDSAENLRVNAEEIREIARISLEGVKTVADMQPPFEGPIVGFDPVLDPARVLATAAVRLDEMHISGGAYLRNYTDGARPYRMCERSVSIAFVDDLEVEPKRAIATAKNIIEAAGWLKTANDLKRFLAEMGCSGSIPYRTKGETNELA